MIPEEKNSILDKAQGTVDDIKINLTDIYSTDGERYNKVIDVWTRASTDMAITNDG